MERIMEILIQILSVFLVVIGCSDLVTIISHKLDGEKIYWMELLIWMELLMVIFLIFYGLLCISTFVLR